MTYTQSLTKLTSVCNLPGDLRVTMTLTYSSEVFTASQAFGGLTLKLLLRWKGSIYQLVWWHADMQGVEYSGSDPGKLRLVYFLSANK